MKVLIVEDEPLAAERLETLLKRYDHTLETIRNCDSVKKTVAWLRQNPQPEILFLDIQLGDGLSFEIFEQVVLDCPVIFTTAYDEYAIEAFKVNSIAYLLKPVKYEELVAAMQKYKTSPWYLETGGLKQQQLALEKAQLMMTKEYRKRFLIKTGLHIHSIPVEEILFFNSLEKATFITLEHGRTYLLDYTLEQLEDLLDPARFYRISRQYIVSVGAIEDIITLSHSRLQLKLKYCSDKDVLVSRDRTQDFKSWLDK
jgi:two-component system, LytTR family, response regulator